MFTRGLKKAKAVFRPFYPFLKKKARSRFRTCLPELLRARRFCMLTFLITRGNDFRPVWTAGHSRFWQSVRSFWFAIQQCQLLGLCIRTVRVSGRSYKAFPANQTCTGRSKNTSGIHAAAVPNGRVRRSLTRQGASIPMRR